MDAQCPVEPSQDYPWPSRADPVREGKGGGGRGEGGRREGGRKGGGREGGRGREEDRILLVVTEPQVTCCTHTTILSQYTSITIPHTHHPTIGHAHLPHAPPTHHLQVFLGLPPVLPELGHTSGIGGSPRESSQGHQTIAHHGNQQPHTPVDQVDGSI